MSATRTLETITPHDLKVGDIVREYGMRLLIDTEPQVSKGHPIQSESQGTTLYVRALITNWDALVEEAEDDAINGTARFIVGCVRGDLNRGDITEPRWTIQGNRWANLARETA